MIKYLIKTTLLFGLVFTFTACVNTKYATYFNEANDTTIINSIVNKAPVIQPKDILSISISSLNTEASYIFNTTNTFVISNTSAAGSNTQSSGYLVDENGFIQLPILGNIKAENLTKAQLKENITNMIVDRKLLVDPIVNIRHLNFEVTVIGEVGHPTVITVPNEKITLLKALGLAGDITIYGKKENVLLIREKAGIKEVRHINLNDKNFLFSPYNNLQPNDIVYVESNKNKLASVSRGTQLVPVFLSALSLGIILVTRL
jgi:polysaccharide export outer membrane protein